MDKTTTTINAKIYFLCDKVILWILFNYMTVSKTFDKNPLGVILQRW